MARLNNETIVLQISKLQRDNEEDDVLLTEELINNLTEVVNATVPDVLVEISNA